MNRCLWRRMVCRGVWSMVLAGPICCMRAETAGVAQESKPAQETTAERAAVLREALKGKRVVTFSYQGHVRTAEPHALGKGNGDKPVLLAWQTGGGSQTAAPPGWRVFQLAEITELKRTEAVFGKARPDYQSRRGGRGLKSIEAEVAVK